MKENSFFTLANLLQQAIKSCLLKLAALKERLEGFKSETERRKLRGLSL